MNQRSLRAGPRESRAAPIFEAMRRVPILPVGLLALGAIAAAVVLATSSASVEAPAAPRAVGGSPGLYGLGLSSLPAGSDYRRMARGGAGTVRFVLDWRRAEPTAKGGFHWGQSDRYIGRAAKSGIAVMPVFFATPGGLRPPSSTRRCSPRRLGGNGAPSSAPRSPATGAAGSSGSGTRACRTTPSATGRSGTSRTRPTSGPRSRRRRRTCGCCRSPPRRSGTSTGRPVWCLAVCSRPGRNIRTRSCRGASLPASTGSAPARTSTSSAPTHTRPSSPASPSSWTGWRR